MVLDHSSFFILKHFIFILFLLEGMLKNIDLRLVGLQFFLCLDQFFLSDFSLVDEGLILLKSLELLFLLHEQISFLLGDVGESFALEE